MTPPGLRGGKGERWMDQRSLKLALRLERAGADDVEIPHRLRRFQERQAEKEGRRRAAPAPEGG